VDSEGGVDLVGETPWLRGVQVVVAALEQHQRRSRDRRRDAFPVRHESIGGDEGVEVTTCQVGRLTIRPFGLDYVRIMFNTL